MKIYSILVIILCFAITMAISSPRAKAVSLQFQRTGNSNCNSRSCPPWKCQDDSAVIHGYCSGCPGYDNVPVPCNPNLVCPASPEPLCSDYNFMMDCCCTGP